MSDGVVLVAAERDRQVREKGYSLEIDQAQQNGELALAAACYASPVPIMVRKQRLAKDGAPEFFWGNAWPWKVEADNRLKHGRIRQLIIAGAFVCAELDRLAGRVGAGVESITAERSRQITDEGWEPEMDKGYQNSELAFAAACYSSPQQVRISKNDGSRCGCSSVCAVCTCDEVGLVDPWPWNKEWDKRDKHSRTHCLDIAGALIAAEIDRLLAEAEEIIALRDQLVQGVSTDV